MIYLLSIWCAAWLIAEIHWTWAIGKWDATPWFYLPFIILTIAIASEYL